jgi:hypothetical protein
MNGTYEFISDHNIRGHTFSVVVFAFFAGGAFFACIAAVFLASFPLRSDGFFPSPPCFVGLANGAADSSESDNGGTAPLLQLSLHSWRAGSSVPPFLLARCSQHHQPCSWILDVFPVPLGFGCLANGRSIGLIRIRRCGGAAPLLQLSLHPWRVGSSASPFPLARCSPRHQPCSWLSSLCRQALVV